MNLHYQLLTLEREIRARIDETQYFIDNLITGVNEGHVKDAEDCIAVLQKSHDTLRIVVDWMG